MLSELPFFLFSLTPTETLKSLIMSLNGENYVFSDVFIYEGIHRALSLLLPGH